MKIERLTESSRLDYSSLMTKKQSLLAKGESYNLYGGHYSNGEVAITGFSFVDKKVDTQCVAANIAVDTERWWEDNTYGVGLAIPRGSTTLNFAINDLEKSEAISIFNTICKSLGSLIDVDDIFSMDEVIAEARKLIKKFGMKKGEAY